MSTSLDLSTSSDRTTRTIRLADGNQWPLSLASQKLKPIFENGPSPDGSIQVQVVFEQSLPVRRRLEDFFKALESETEVDHFETFLALSVELIREGSRIERSTAVQLLNVEEEDYPRLILEATSIALGEKFQTTYAYAKAKNHD